MKTEVSLSSVQWARKRFPLIRNGVLEKIMDCAHVSSKLEHGT